MLFCALLFSSCEDRLDFFDGDIEDLYTNYLSGEVILLSKALWGIIHSLLMI